MAKIHSYFLNNIDINGRGAVAASPSHKNPDYWYHWQRDSAISMRISMTFRDVVSPGVGRDALVDYLKWVHAAQFASDPNGQDIRGEPKFFIENASCYNGPWMRPQNDGPALRVVTLLMWAKKLLAAGEEDFVKQGIYTADASLPGVKRDLEYLFNTIDAPSGDPWEEVRGDVFFAKFSYRAAFHMAAEVGKLIGDDASTVQKYADTALQLQADILATHWNSGKNLLMEVPGQRELDSATHLGVLYGYLDDSFLDPADTRVQSSVAHLVDTFSSYNYPDFSINGADDAAGLPGILIGRYPHDVYNGGNPSQSAGGNPWILCTASLAEVYYRAAQLYSVRGSIRSQDINPLFLKQAAELGGLNQSVATEVLEGIESANGVTALGSPLFTSVSRILLAGGDGVLTRVHAHVVGQDFHMTEQINKKNGDPQGAEDLTWSYGTVILAMDGRAAAAAAVAQAVEAEARTVA